MLRVALTGGIASGKSAAAADFRALGVPIIDTDQVAREQVEPGTPGLQQLVETFGAGVLDASGQLDRAQLRQRIFSDTEARQQVNAILHPRIMAEVTRRLDSMSGPYAVVEVPVLAETGLGAMFDRIVVVDADDDTRLARLMQRDAIGEREARQALAAQASREDRLRAATDVLPNDGSRSELAARVKALHERLLDEASRFASEPGCPAE